jgi:hypothetical protein
MPALFQGGPNSAVLRHNADAVRGAVDDGEIRCSRLTLSPIFPACQLSPPVPRDVTRRRIRLVPDRLQKPATPARAGLLAQGPPSAYRPSTGAKQVGATTKQRAA